MLIRKLSSMPYAQAHVEIDAENKAIYLFSYTTLVAGIVDGWAFCNGLYSNTTRRHISAFAKEYGVVIDYYTFKLLYEENLIMDITTGEVVDRD